MFQWQTRPMDSQNPPVIGRIKICAVNSSFSLNSAINFTENSFYNELYCTDILKKLHIVVLKDICNFASLFTLLWQCLSSWTTKFIHYLENYHLNLYPHTDVIPWNFPNKILCVIFWGLTVMSHSANLILFNRPSNIYETCKSWNFSLISFLYNFMPLWPSTVPSYTIYDLKVHSRFSHPFTNWRNIVK